MGIVSLNKVKMIDVVNRRGFACICQNNLTEGDTLLQAYERMRKAIKRGGSELPEAKVADLKKCLTNI